MDDVRTSSPRVAPEETEERIRSLEALVARLTKTNTVLMRRVEEGIDASGADYSLFLHATVLEQKVRERTKAVEEALERVEISNGELRAAKEAAEEALLTKDSFLAGMSHELRTPLNAVLGHSETLLEGLLGPLSPAQRASLSMIASSGRHLLGSINDILDITTVQAGEATLSLTEVNLETICEAGIATVAIEAVKKGIRLGLEMHPREVVMSADEHRLNQIVVNLLGNAIKFTPDGGDIRLKVFGDADSGWVRLEVHDTGIGIPPEDVERLFDPFVQLENGLARGYDGSGLGLAIVREMAQLHGGSASARSELGKGSVFIVTLPWEGGRTTDTWASDQDPTPLDDAPPPRVSVGQTILLAEDNEANIGMIKPYLMAKGYDVIVARNGAEAHRAAVMSVPDLILMDVQMPGMDGLESTRLIRAEPELKGIPIIALTALAMPGDRERCIEAGANDYLTKPVGLNALVGTIQRFVEESARSGD
jgi:signal transduction histidine kinase/ActR/RegA family two-component response regulator